jgi:hypothetical protein
MPQLRRLLPEIHRLLAKSVFVPRFAIGGNLDNEHGDSGEQQQMDPASLLSNEQDEPEQNQT